MAEQIYLYIYIVWYLLALVLILFLAFKYKNKIKTEARELVHTNNDLTFSEISFLLNGKITKEIMITEVLALIKNRVIEVNRNNSNFTFKINEELKKKTKGSAYYVLSVLEEMGTNEFKDLSKYYKGNERSTDFLTIYRLWKKQITTEMNKNDFVVVKSDYFAVKDLNLIGITLFLINFFYGFHFLVGYLILPVVIFLSRYFRKLRKIRKEYKTDYINYLNYKLYLKENINKVNFKDTLGYIAVFKLSKLVTIKNEDIDFLVMLESELKKCINRANLTGNRTIFGIQIK